MDKAEISGAFVAPAAEAAGAAGGAGGAAAGGVAGAAGDFVASTNDVATDAATDDAAEAANAKSSTDVQAEGLAELQQEIDNLRDELATVLLEIDDIVLQVNPRILREYEVTVGCYEAELLREQIAARRAKRKLALLRSALNRGEAVNLDAIEATLDKEFEDWESILQEKTDAYLASLALKTNTRTLTTAESEELSKLHKELIKRLHPDMNQGNEEECQAFFLLAQQAFERGDLIVLRSLEVATAHLGKRPKQLGAESDAAIELALVEAQLGITKEQLEALKSSNPYLLADKLADRAWMKETTGAIAAQTAEQRELRDAFEAEIAALIEQL